MPEKKTIERARKDRRAGKAPSTQAGRVRARGDPPRPRGKARSGVDEAGDCDRLVQGAPGGGRPPRARGR